MELLYLGVNLWCDAHCPCKSLALLPWVSSVLSISQPWWGCYCTDEGLVRLVSAEVTNVLKILYINILVLFLY